MKPHPLIWIVPAVLSLIALGPLPYSYYQLLRVVVCGSCAFLAFAEHRAGGGAWKFGLGGVALVFNPFVPVHLTREVWAVLNVVLAVFLIAHWRMRTRSLS